MNFFFKARLLIFLLVISFLQLQTANSQSFTVEGVIFNQADEISIPLVNVFFSGTTIGTMSNENGKFEITDLEPGQYQLIISHINYDVQIVPIQIIDRSINLGQINLSEKKMEVSSVMVEGETNNKWKRQFNRFKRFVLGENYKDRDIKVANAYASDFIESKEALSLGQPFPLEFENRYTGYKIYYHVEDFQMGKNVEQFVFGYPSFTELEPSNDRQKRRWERNREVALKGSLRHFFSSLLNSNLEANQYTAAISELPKGAYFTSAPEPTLNIPVSSFNVPDYMSIEPTESKGIYKVSLNGFLRMDYFGEKIYSGVGQTTYIEAPKGQFYLLENGLVLNPDDLKLHGYLAKEGLYELLPLDYESTSTPESVQALSAEAASFDNALEALDHHTFDYLLEKVYLHLDKPYYSKGDNLWFKAYALEGPKHTPTSNSENLYVELINAGKVLKRLTVYLNNGLGRGDFDLADSLPAGEYTIRAYTNWMRNNDEDFFFQKQIQLIDPIGLNAEKNPENASAYQISFYPEGGELITNLSSKVAFEITNQLEKLPIEIIDDLGEVITTASTEHEGMGSFELKPLKGRTYFAKVNGTAAKHALPTPQRQGLVLSVDNISDDEKVIVNIRSTSPEEQENEAFLVAHTRGLVGFASKIEWEGSSATISIPKDRLATGIVHVTLFDENWNPEAERLIFKKQNTALIKVRLETDQERYKVRDSTKVKLTVENENGEPLRGFFSMSVFDTKQIKPEAIKSNIISNLLLSSDFRGEISNASQYFDQNNSNADEQLNLLLMTKGWRRFNWKDVLNGKFPESKFEVEQGFDVTGKVTQGGVKKSVSKGMIKQIGNFNGQPIFETTTTKGDGTFEFKNLRYNEDITFVQAQNKKGNNNVILELNEVNAPILSDEVILEKDNLGPIKVEEAFVSRSRERRNIDSVFSFENVTDLGTFVVKGTKNNVVSSNISRGMVFNRGEYGLDVTDLMARGQKFRNALYLLQGRVPGILILPAESGEPNVILDRKVWSLQNPDPPTIYLIDDAITSLAAVTAMPAELIARVEVLKGMKASGIYGESANGGAIAFYTKTSDEYDEYYKRLAENNMTLTKNSKGLSGGYYKSREFYGPNYTAELPGHIKPDHRDLIHWEPMIETDENGEAIIKFFNADLPTTIQVNLEGIWEGGIPLATSIDYQVKRK